MRYFLREYGRTILIAVITIVLIALTGPLKGKIQNSVLDLMNKMGGDFESIGSSQNCECTKDLTGTTWVIKANGIDSTMLADEGDWVEDPMDYNGGYYQDWTKYEFNIDFTTPGYVDMITSEPTPLHHICLWPDASLEGYSEFKYTQIHYSEYEDMGFTVMVDGSNWYSDDYRTITITGGEDATNPRLIEWFEKNAKLNSGKLETCVCKKKENKDTKTQKDYDYLWYPSYSFTGFEQEDHKYELNVTINDSDTYKYVYSYMGQLYACNNADGGDFTMLNRTDNYDSTWNWRMKGSDIEKAGLKQFMKDNGRLVIQLEESDLEKEWTFKNTLVQTDSDVYLCYDYYAMSDPITFESAGITYKSISWSQNLECGGFSQASLRYDYANTATMSLATIDVYNNGAWTNDYYYDSLYTGNPEDFKTIKITDVNFETQLLSAYVEDDFMYYSFGESEMLTNLWDFLQANATTAKTETQAEEHEETGSSNLYRTDEYITSWPSDDTGYGVTYYVSGNALVNENWMSMNWTEREMHFDNICFQYDGMDYMISLSNDTDMTSYCFYRGPMPDSWYSQPFSDSYNGSYLVYLEIEGGTDQNNSNLISWLDENFEKGYGAENTFNVSLVEYSMPIATDQFTYKEGMTWNEWLNSSYSKTGNSIGNIFLSHEWDYMDDTTGNIFAQNPNNVICDNDNNGNYARPYSLINGMHNYIIYPR